MWLMVGWWWLVCSSLLMPCTIQAEDKPGPSMSTGTLEVRITDDREAIDDFTALILTISAVRLHQRDKPRQQGWIELKPTTQEVDLTKAVSDPVVIFNGEAPTGGYNAITLTAGLPSGQLKGGKPARIELALQPVAVSFGIQPGKTTVVVLDLVTLDLSDHPGKNYAVVIKTAFAQTL
jgi:hypothetical protein